MNYSQGIATIGALTVAGVKKTLAYMPDQINTVDLPLMFPVLPRGENAVTVLTGAKGLESLHLDWWVLVEPSAQNKPPARFAECVGVLDGLMAAFATSTAVDAYSMRMEMIRIESTTYWGIVAEIEVS